MSEIQTTKLIVIRDYHPHVGYPNANRVSLMFWECQNCKDRKLDCDLYKDTGLCGDCQSLYWEQQRTKKGKRQP